MSTGDSRDQNRVKGSSSDHLPHKPTRETAAGSERPEALGEQRGQPSGMETPEHLGSERQPVDEGGNRRHPPHVGRHEVDAPVQDEMTSPDAAPILPANASGADQVTPDQQDRPMDPESMYDDRPERYEQAPPSKRVRDGD